MKKRCVVSFLIIFSVNRNFIIAMITTSSFLIVLRGIIVQILSRYVRKGYQQFVTVLDLKPPGAQLKLLFQRLWVQHPKAQAKAQVQRQKALVWAVLLQLERFRLQQNQRQPSMQTQSTVSTTTKATLFDPVVFCRDVAIGFYPYPGDCTR